MIGDDSAVDPEQTGQRRVDLDDRTDLLPTILACKVVRPCDIILDGAETVISDHTIGQRDRRIGCPEILIEWRLLSL